MRFIIGYGVVMFCLFYNVVYGWLNFNKFKGIIFIVVFLKVCGLFWVKKVGYVGILDFFVLGVFFIVFGEVMKIVLKMMDCIKVYMFMVKWGE